MTRRRAERSTGHATRDQRRTDQGTVGKGRRLADRGPVRRRSLLAPARAAGLLGMLVAGLLLKLVTGSPQFALAAVDMSALRWTASAAVEASLGVPLGTSIFGIETAPLEAALRNLPAVASATVSVSLPDRLVVRVEERVPILAWQVGRTSFLVDRDGSVFAWDDASTVARNSLPTIVDARTSSTSALFVGARLDPVDLDVATRLGTLEPADVRSGAPNLQVHVDDADGFSLTSGRGSWIAVFGFYSPALRSTDLIPGQVQLLGSLLAGREASVARVILADDRTGTYVPKPTTGPTSGP